MQSIRGDLAAHFFKQNTWLLFNFKHSIPNEGVLRALGVFGSLVAGACPGARREQGPPGKSKKRLPSSAQSEPRMHSPRMHSLRFFFQVTCLSLAARTGTSSLKGETHDPALGAAPPTESRSPELINKHSEPG